MKKAPCGKCRPTAATRCELATFVLVRGPLTDPDYRAFRVWRVSKVIPFIPAAGTTTTRAAATKETSTSLPTKGSPSLVRAPPPYSAYQHWEQVRNNSMLSSAPLRRSTNVTTQKLILNGQQISNPDGKQNARSDLVKRYSAARFIQNSKTKAGRVLFAICRSLAARQATYPEKRWESLLS